MKPSISVIMPVYNMSDFIHESIDSILNQTFSDFELIIIDDASTDKSAEIIHSYNDPRICFIKNNVNLGNYKSRNIGIKQAHGKYICVMDADDIAFKDRLKSQYAFMEGNKSILACGSQFICLNSQSIYSKPQTYISVLISLMENNCFLHPSLLIRIETMRELGGYNEKYLYASDYDLVCNIALKGKILNLPDTLMQYRIHANQISSTKQALQKEYADVIRLNYMHNLIKKITNKELSSMDIQVLKDDKKGKALVFSYLAKYFNDNRFKIVADKILETLS